MKKSQKKIKKQNNLEIENNAILDKILSERLLADYSVQDEVKILLLFTDKYVATLSNNYSFSSDIEFSKGYLNKKISLKQLHQRERLALNNLDKLDEFSKNIQELTLLFLNANFLDGVEQNQDIGSFLFLLSNIQDGLCEKFYNFLKTIWSKTETKRFLEKRLRALDRKEKISRHNTKAVKHVNDMVLKEISFYQAKYLWSILLCSNWNYCPRIFLIYVLSVK